MKMNILGLYQIVPFDAVGHFQLRLFSVEQLRLLTDADMALIHDDPIMYPVKSFIREETTEQMLTFDTRQTFFELPKYFKIDEDYGDQIYFQVEGSMYMGYLS